MFLGQKLDKIGQIQSEDLFLRPLCFWNKNLENSNIRSSVVSISVVSINYRFDQLSFRSSVDSIKCPFDQVSF